MDVLKESLSAQNPRGRTPPWSFRIAATFCLALIYAWLQSDPRRYLGRLTNDQQPESFDWSEQKPTPHLVYTPCFAEYECARLEVPLDWNETTPGPRAAIAVIRLPAQVPVIDPRYGGPILINPGGPGGSAVSEVLTRGKLFQSIVDMRNASSKSSNLALDDNLKYFDLIGFDPRGVNNSTPHLHCFPDSIARQIWDAQASAEGLFESSDDSFDLMWARAKALGQACSDDGTGIAQFMNTPVVVADMVAIIERHGEWREQEARLLLERAEDMSSDKTGVILERTRWKRGEEVLQYWGFSYGTILGQTFAALQPSRVSRLVLDGVVDIGDYYRGDWMKNLLLADQIVGKFYEYCHRAGPSNCAFYSGSSARDIKKRLHNLLGVIKENPVFIGTSETYGPKIFTYSDVMLEIRESLYEPLDRFPQIATLLAALASPLSRSSVEVIAGYKFRADYRITHKSSGDGVFVPTGIFCSDGPDLTSTNKSSLLAYAEPLAAQSKYVGASWITHRLECSGWVTRPRWEFDYRNAGGKTRHPILFVGNTLDPVTPLSNAHENAAMWEGSGVLEVRGEGHCTYAVESACTNRVIGRYFQTGDMPERGKVCEVDRKPFEAKN